MKHRTQSEEVARLSGFLYGISTFSGTLRQYEGYPYLIDAPSESVSVEMLINSHFREQHKFSFGTNEELSGGLGDVETGIREHLIKDSACVRPETIEDIRRYVSFRVMDMVDDIFESFGKRLEAVCSKLVDEDGSSSGRSTFFCIRCSGLLLALQFNDYTDRK